MNNSDISYGKLAGKLTLIYFLSTAVLVSLFIFLTYNLQLSKNFIYFGILVVFVLGTYFCVGWYLRKNYTQWNIALVKDGVGLRRFSGSPLVSIFFGFYWRSIFLGVVTGAIGAFLKRMYGEYLTEGNGFTIDAVTGLLNCYIAFYWLLKVQYGSYGIVALNKSAELFGNVIIENNEIISDAKTSIKDAVVGVLGTTAVMSYYALGLVQIFATYNFFKYYWEWNGVVSFFAAMFTGYMPILGSIAGVMGATKVWGWELWAAMLLFFFPFAIWLLVIILGGTVGLLGSAFSKRK